MADERSDDASQRQDEGSAPTSEVLHVGAEVDVRALMREIRAEVERKRAAGAYPPELLAQLGPVYGPDDLGRSLADVKHALMSSPYQPITSHRRTVGPAIVFGKRAVRRALRWHTQGISQQTQAIGGSLSRALESTAEQVKALEKEVTSLREDVARMRREAAAVGSGAASPAGGRDTDTIIDYVAFEDRFRGPGDELSRRQSRYLPYFRDAGGRVLDVGCGRGEFLRALRAEGVDAYGVDYNADMVALCHRSGLDVAQGDAIEHLRSLDAGTLGGIFCAQVLEHLDKRSVVEFFSLAARAIRAGGVLVAETLNPQALCTFTGPLYVDLDHTQPLHPLTLQFLAESAGFQDVAIEHPSPMPPEYHLEPLPTDGVDASLAPAMERIDANFRKVDDILYGSLDFAIVARLPG